MPCPPPVSRRVVLAGPAVLTAVVTGGLTAGCTGPGTDGPAARPSPQPSRRENPDATLASDVLARERLLLDRVVATVHRHPKLAGTLAGARVGHREHVALLRRAVPPEPSGSPTAGSPGAGSPSAASPTAGSPAAGSAAASSPAPGSSTSSVPANGRPAVPRNATSALAALSRAEDDLSRSVQGAALAARSGGFARVLASMAAAAAQQAVHLGAAATESR